MKTKHFIIGLISGALLATTASVYAAPAMKKISAVINKNITLKVDGKPVITTNPILNYDGKTYVYVKEVGQLVGANVTWNGNDKSVEITSNKNDGIANSQSNQNDNVTQTSSVDPKNAKLVKITDEDLKADTKVWFNGNEFVQRVKNEESQIVILVEENLINIINMDDGKFIELTDNKDYFRDPVDNALYFTKDVFLKVLNEEQKHVIDDLQKYIIK